MKFSGSYGAFREVVWLSVTALASIVAPISALATQTVVDSRQNLYGAGFGSPVAFDGLGPVEIDFAAGPIQVLAFSSVVGSVNYYGGALGSTEGPDGYGASFSPYPTGGFPDVFTPTDGLSGLKDDNNAAYLVGVFLTAAQPAAPAPPRLDFTNAKSFVSLSPVINQFFFIGDGRTGTGTGDIQQFYVPPTATRLFLGFLDTGFSDNIGSLTADYEISVAPEPSAIGVSASTLLLLLRRKK